MNWVKKRVKTKVRNKARARVTEVGLAPVETLVVEAVEILAEAEVETPVVEAVEILAEAEVETPVVEAMGTFKMKGPGPLRDSGPRSNCHHSLPLNIVYISDGGGC
jgi:hypothetical protein